MIHNRWDIAKRLRVYCLIHCQPTKPYKSAAILGKLLPRQEGFSYDIFIHSAQIGEPMILGRMQLWFDSAA